MNEKDLLKLKERIDQAKTKTAELKGRKDGLMQQLFDQWDCKSIEKAQEKLQELSGQLKEAEKSIEEGIKQIQEKLQ